MRFLPLTIATLAAAVLAEEVTVDVTREVECDRKTKRGDKIEVHYRGTLQDGGKQFDASYDRGSPLEFVVGQGQVIKGWDDNLLDMCIGEKRTLTIPPKFGYGDRAMGPIPAGSTLIFETELMGIAGVPKPEKIIEKAAKSVASDASESATSAASGASESATSVASDASETASSVVSKASSGVKEAIKSKIADAAEAAKVIIADTDGDGQEHNEL